MHEPSLEQFQKDIREHQMTIENDNGVHRSIYFGRERSGNMHFRITTWVGHLAISGDMGTYVFSRTNDMFNFFRCDEGGTSINPSYWSEKVKSECTWAKGIRKFDFELFKESVIEHAKYCVDEDKIAEVIASVEENMLSCIEEDEYGAVAAIRDWSDPDDLGIDFSDLSYSRSERFAYHYIWCCRAIVWAIHQYYKYKEAGE